MGQDTTDQCVARSAEAARAGWARAGGHGLQYPRAEGRNQGDGEEERGRHGDGRGQRNRAEEVARRSRKERDREEDDAECCGGDQHGRGDLGRALECGLKWRMALVHVPDDRFHDHNRLVDQNADDQGEPADRHRIERRTRKVETRERREDRKWQAGQDQHGRAQAPEKQHDDQRREARAKDALQLQGPQGVPHVDRLVEHDLDRKVPR